MLGSDPVSSLLGAGVNPCAPKSVWKWYARALISNGCAVVMLGPDVTVPPDADASTLRGLRDLLAEYPPLTQMPSETTGKLAGTSPVTTDAMTSAMRVEAYYKRIGKALTPHLSGKEEKDAHTRCLIENGTVTPSMGIHVKRSGLVSVEIPDADALTRWRTWAFELSDDYHERHTAPTLLMPGLPGGGIFLFRQPQPLPALEMRVNSILVSSGNTVVPVPPTRQGGREITRLGPVRTIPDWLREQFVSAGVPEPLQRTA
jgi:hypothetical protein